MFYLKNRITQICSLIFTAAPGVIRAMIFTLLYLSLPEFEYVESSISYSNAIIIGLVGGIGVGTALIKYESQISSSLWLFIMSIVISIPVYVFFYVDSSDIFLKVLLMSIGILANFIFRFYIISFKRFYLGGVVEAINFLCLAGVSLLLPGEIYEAVFIVYISNLLVLSVIKSDRPALQESYHPLVKVSIFVGYTSLISSGLVFFLPSISGQWSDPELNKTLGLMIALIGIISIIPRAILNNELSNINRAIVNNDKALYEKISKKTKKLINIVVIPAVLILLVYVILMLGYMGSQQLTLILMVGLFVYIGQFSLVESNVINFFGKEKFSFLINTVIFIVFMLSAKYMPLLISESFLGLSMVMVISSLLYLLRYFLFKRTINKCWG